jgi:type I site-specific restriction endonuclease
MKTRSPAQPANSEWLTRKKLIDSLLKAAGWKVVPFVPGKPLLAQESCAIEEFPTGAGPADYALCADGQIIGIVEAKKLTLGPKNVLSQAERYSKGVDQPGLRFGEFRVPFLYSTNGEVIWYHDIRHKLNRSRQLKPGGHGAMVLPDNCIFEGKAGEVLMLGVQAGNSFRADFRSWLRHCKFSLCSSSAH